MKDPETQPSADDPPESPAVEGRPRPPLQIGSALVVPVECMITLEGRRERVDDKAMQVLLCLADRAGRVVEKETIFHVVWPSQAIIEDAVPVAIRNLRRALGDDARAPRFIETIPSGGYRLIAPVHQAHSRSAPIVAVAVIVLLALLVALASFWLSRS